MGVILMSSYTSLSPPSTEPDTGASAVLLGNTRDELVHEHAIVGGDVFDSRIQPVVAEQRGYRHGKSRHRRGKRGGGSGSDGINVHIARQGDRGKCNHHADDRAQQSE